MRPEETIKSDPVRFARDFNRDVIRAIEELPLDKIAEVATRLYNAKEEDRQIFLFGNGGSLSIASHLACDLGKGSKHKPRPGGKFYRIHSLDNPAWLSAQANDGAEPFIEGDYPGEYQHGYDGIFVGQMENFLNEGDIAFGISSSGNSRNVVNALLYARSRGAFTIALLGFDGGRAAEVADLSVIVATPKGAYGVVESVHEVVHHLLYEYARELERD